MKRKSISIITPPAGRVGAGFILRTALALGFIALAGTGCQNPFPFGGGEIEFSVSTGYENDGDIGGEEPGGSEDGTTPQTKTAYSGAFVTLPSGRHERIDWVNGDRISIWCDKVAESVKRHDYSVSSHSASGAQSHATIAPVSASPHWGFGNNFVFYAMYPAASTPGVDASKVSLNGNVMRGTIPSAQVVTLKPGTRTYVPDMKYAYMYAATTMASAGPVSLPFKSMVTAFEFTVDSWDDPTLTLYSAVLHSSSQALTGDFTATVTSATGENAACSYAVPPRTSANSWINVYFGGTSGITITKGQPVTFTVFALPQNITGLTMKFNTSKGERSLPLSHAGGGSMVFNSCQKYRFGAMSVPGKPYNFFLNVSNSSFTVPYTGGTASATVRSYKVNRFTGTQTAVPWQVAGYYADAACTVPYNGNATLKPDWLTLSAYSGGGSTTGEAQNATCAASPAAATTSQNTYNLSQSSLSGAPQVGSPTRYWNLANPVDGGDYIRESANCYIVNAPGYYRIPLVVGNGVKNNAPNAVAYTAANFKDYLDANISSPYLQKTHAGAGVPTTAFVVRQEGSKFLAVINETSWILAPVSGSSSAITSTGSGTNKVYWLNFSISRANIRPATAVIAVRDAQGRIMWSWHIWVTDYVPKNYPAYASSGLKDIPVTNRTNRVYTFMPRNLGEVTYGTTRTVRYDARRVYVKLTQNPSAGTATAVLAITQSGMLEHLENLNPRGTHSPLYVFGRKDPIMGGNGFSLDIPTFYGVWPTFHGYHRERHTVGWSIQNPHRYNGQGYGTDHPYDWCNPAWQTNWWSAGNTSQSPNDNPVIKTIYDPSPAGYHVPASNAFTRFTTTGGNPPANSFNQFNVKDMDGNNVINGNDFNIGQGWHFYTDATRTKTIHFIVQGFRGAPDGGYSAPFGMSYWRTVTPWNDHASSHGSEIDAKTYVLRVSSEFVNPTHDYYGTRSELCSVRAVQD